MNNDTVVSLAAPARVSDPLTELLRTGARRLIEAAVSAEFEEYLSGFVQEQLPDGRQRVVRNGHLPDRKILTGVGEVDVRVPKARSRSGSPEPFRSSVVPPYVRRCASLDAAIPWLYLHGVSTGQMRQAVGALVGEEAARGLSANVVSRLKRSWDEEYRQWCRRRLDDEWVYLWADGIYSGLRGDHERLCVLVPEDPANAAVRLLADADNGQFYIGQIVSFGPAAGRRAAMWALTRALHPGLNLEGPSENPPDGKHCVTVFSTFWLWDETEQDHLLVGPPAGFPTLVLFNSYGHAEEPLVEMELWQSHFRQIG